MRQAARGGMLCPMATNNPFRKESTPPSQITVSFTGEQKELLDQLREHLGFKRNGPVILEGLALLYDKNARQMAKATDQAE